jgi:hypothetical protein
MSKYAVSSSLRMILSYPITCYDHHFRGVRLFLKWPFLAFPYCVHIPLLRSEYPFMAACVFQVVFSIVSSSSKLRTHVAHYSTTQQHVDVRVCVGVRSVTFLIFYDFRKGCVEVQKLTVTSDSSKRIRNQ